MRSNQMQKKSKIPVKQTNSGMDRLKPEVNWVHVYPVYKDFHLVMKKVFRYVSTNPRNLIKYRTVCSQWEEVIASMLPHVNFKASTRNKWPKPIKLGSKLFGRSFYNLEGIRKVIALDGHPNSWNPFLAGAVNLRCIDKLKQTCKYDLFFFNLPKLLSSYYAIHISQLTYEAWGEESIRQIGNFFRFLYNLKYLKLVVDGGPTYQNVWSDREIRWLSEPLPEHNSFIALSVAVCFSPHILQAILQAYGSQLKMFECNGKAMEEVSYFDPNQINAPLPLPNLKQLTLINLDKTPRHYIYPTWSPTHLSISDGDYIDWLFQPGDVFRPISRHALYTSFSHVIDMFGLRLIELYVHFTYFDRIYRSRSVTSIPAPDFDRNLTNLRVLPHLQTFGINYEFATEEFKDCLYAWLKKFICLKYLELTGWASHRQFRFVSLIPADIEDIRQMNIVMKGLWENVPSTLIEITVSADRDENHKRRFLRPNEQLSLPNNSSDPISNANAMPNAMVVVENAPMLVNGGPARPNNIQLGNGARQVRPVRPIIPNNPPVQLRNVAIRPARRVPAQTDSRPRWRN